MTISNFSVISDHFPNLTNVQKKQFADLEPIYLDWNSKINLISRKDSEHLYTRHVLHSLGIAKVLSFKAGSTILDVGTGGGFPGIPLAILFPESKFHLIDSIGKKIKVVDAISKELGLMNVTTEHLRAEQIKDKYDFIVSRAVTRLKPFRQWVKKKIKPDSHHSLKNGILYLKGGDLTEELKEAKCKHKIFHLATFFKDSFFETKKVVYTPA